jgi:hypothetical protein
MWSGPPIFYWLDVRWWPWTLLLFLRWLKVVDTPTSNNRPHTLDFISWWTWKPPVQFIDLDGVLSWIFLGCFFLQIRLRLIFNNRNDQCLVNFEEYVLVGNPSKSGEAFEEVKQFYCTCLYVFSPLSSIINNGRAIVGKNRSARYWV